MFWELIFEDLRAAQPVLRAVFRSPQGGTACFGDLFCEHFRAARPVLGSCFVNTLGRHSVFWELLCENFRAAQRVLDEFWRVLGSVPPWGLEDPHVGAQGY